MVNLLYKRLLARGYEDIDILHVFKEATTKLDTKYSLTGSFTHKTAEKTAQDGDRNDLFFHLQYHKRDISRQCIRNYFEKTCEAPDRYGNSFKSYPTPNSGIFKTSKLTIAYSRPDNIRDKLAPSTLFETETCNVIQTLQEMTLLHGQAP